MAVNADKVVELGFVEKVENSTILTSPFFPSKIGGKPAWLALSGQPICLQISCRNCNKPLVFLLQVYTPSDDEKSSAYHRTVFVFCCRNGACYKSNSNNCFLALRCQLFRENKFYPPVLGFRKQDEIFQEFEAKRSTEGAHWPQLCEVCGCRGEKLCGRCHRVHYCSREHQTVDWRAGHKLLCNTEGQATNKKTVDQKVSSILFPEYELVTEPEEIDSEENDDDEDSKRKYEDYLKDHKNGEACSDSDWNALEIESKEINSVVEDKTYCKFKKKISHEPEQVLRYQRHGDPLWVSKLNKPNEGDIPKCQCGAPRTFEFQILPQLLNHLKADTLQASIDWGTLAVYTCSQNCSREDTTYYEEFVWKQDFSDAGLPAEILSKLKM